MISIERVEYYKSHWHDEMLEFAMVLEGSIDVNIGCDSYRMKEGNILLIGTEDVHSFRKTDDANSVLFTRFDCRLLEKDFPGIINWNLIGDPAVEESAEQDFGRLRFLIADLALAETDGNDTSQETSRLLNYCRDAFLSTNLLLRKQNVSAEQMEIFNKLALYIQKSYTKTVTLGDVADYINYSFNYTSSIIKQITGMNFTDYLNHIRVLAAERMLISTDKNIIDIALECGFNDARAMGRYFKNWYKLPPGEYRTENNRRFPETSLSSFTEIEFNDAEIQKKLKSYINSSQRIISIDFDKHSGGEMFKPPVLGLDPYIINTDVCGTLPRLSKGILDGSIKTLKQTDDDGRTVFHGDCGLSTHSGIKKPAFYLYEFISEFKSILIREESICLAASDSGFMILLYPAEEIDPAAHREIVRFLFKSVKHNYIIKRITLNCNRGNPYRLWDKLGSPPKLSAEFEELIIKHSVPDLDFSIVRNRDTFELNEELPQEGVVMIELNQER